ncbi:MAG: hypothetical protein RO009_22395 [Pseudorhodoplanes sp.]|jgi:hypothetical protein|nr:hypothetical protein [Pseudorhodoplanes sp.]
MIRLGIIGISEGNGHPYSWAAICNGYDQEAMAQCGFPSIPDYLAQRIWPQDRLDGVTVTHVWAQDSDRARHIAKASRIRTVVSKPEQMIGAIDGLLLARDDAENHAALSAPFLASGIPVYIDKAPALSVTDFDGICARQSRPGLLFTGTAVAYASELKLDSAVRDAIGPIRHVIAMTPKSWDRYSIHIIEPVLRLLGTDAIPEICRTWSHEGARGLDASIGEALVQFSALGSITSPIALRVIGENNWTDLIFRDPFSCFRAALSDFVGGIRDGYSRCDLGVVRQAIWILEQGRG